MCRLLVELLIAVCLSGCGSMLPAPLEIKELAHHVERMATVHMINLLLIVRPVRGPDVYIPVSLVRPEELALAIEEANQIREAANILARTLERCPSQEELWTEWNETIEEKAEEEKKQ